MSGAAGTRGFQRRHAYVTPSAGRRSNRSLAFLSLFLAAGGRWRCSGAQGWHASARIAHDTGVNQESLERANAFLAAVAGAGRAPARSFALSPAEIGREIGVDEPLAAARAVRALLARRRLEPAEGGYRLLDARPIEAGEREQVPRPRRARGRKPIGHRERPTRAGGRAADPTRTSAARPSSG